jgi:putative membrane protein
MTPSSAHHDAETVAKLRAEAASARWPLAAILSVSVLACGLLLMLVYARPLQSAEAPWVAGLPLLNAFLNGVSATCVVMGVRAIRARREWAHRRWMLSAFAASAGFLVSYIAYHALHGDTKFMGQGWIRPTYFFILISHIGLSVVVLPLVLFTFFLSLSGRLSVHRRLARWTFPLWTYVSVTGIVIVALLKAYNH